MAYMPFCPTSTKTVFVAVEPPQFVRRHLGASAGDDHVELGKFLAPAPRRFFRLAFASRIRIIALLLHLRQICASAARGLSA